ncbi:MAG: hypothetical protein JWO15_3280 [Sphingomonadales bacterium]|nr:hypothetical protein [Sphingomonadales bacterium]
MAKVSNLNYHCAREVIEREAALLATCPDVQEKHFVLAEMHADRAWSIMEGHMPYEPPN